MNRLLIVTVCLFGLSAPAIAGHDYPHAGETVNIRNTVLCDERIQLESIMIAQKESMEAGIAVFRSLLNERNVIGDPVYGYLRDPVPLTLGETLSQIDDVYGPNNQTMTMYITPVLYRQRDGAYAGGYIFTSEPILKPGEEPEDPA